MNLTIPDVLRLLRQLDPGLPALRIDYGDPRLDWSLFDCDDDGIPGIDQGQREDCRWPQEDGSSVHAHWMEDHVLFHLDQHDPAESPLSHLLTETNFGRGAVLGAIAGALLGPAGIVAGALVGGGAGTVLAPPTITSVWTLDDVAELIAEPE